MSSVNPLNVESKAVEEGLRATLQADGTFTTPCRGSCGQKGRNFHVVRVGTTPRPDAWHLKLSCDCLGGQARPREETPCFHSAAVARRLERLGWVKWDAGAWVLTGKGMEALTGQLEPPVILEDHDKGFQRIVAEQGGIKYVCVTTGAVAVGQWRLLRTDGTPGGTIPADRERALDRALMRHRA